MCGLECMLLTQHESFISTIDTKEASQLYSYAKDMCGLECMLLTQHESVISTIDTKEASQLYSYAKDMCVSGVLEDDAWLEDLCGTADRSLSTASTAAALLPLCCFDIQEMDNRSSRLNNHRMGQRDVSPTHS